jgi:hypothetical protein
MGCEVVLTFANLNPVWVFIERLADFLPSAKTQGRQTAFHATTSTGLFAN